MKEGEQMAVPPQKNVKRVEKFGAVKKLGTRNYISIKEINLIYLPSYLTRRLYL